MFNFMKTDAKSVGASISQTGKMQEKVSCSRVLRRLLLPYMARFLPFNKRFYLAQALFRSKDTHDKEIVLEVVRDAILDCTGQKPGPDTNKSMLFMVFQDLRWVMTSDEIKRVSRVKYPDMRSDGKMIQKKVLLHDWNATEKFDFFFTRQEGFPVNNHDNVDAFLFSLLMTRMHLAEYGIDEVSQAWKTYHISFYLAWAGRHSKVDKVNELVRSNWNTFVERFSLNLSHGNINPPEDYVMDVIRPLVRRVLKARQCIDIGMVATPFSRLDKLLKLGFSQALSDEQASQMDKLLEEVSLNYIQKKFFVIPPTIFALHSLLDLMGGQNKSMVKLAKNLAMRYEPEYDWKYKEPLINLCSGCAECGFGFNDSDDEDTEVQDSEREMETEEEKEEEAEGVVNESE